MAITSGSSQAARVSEIKRLYQMIQGKELSDRNLLARISRDPGSYFTSVLEKQRRFIESRKTWIFNHTNEAGLAAGRSIRLPFLNTSVSRAKRLRSLKANDLGPYTARFAIAKGDVYYVFNPSKGIPPLPPGPRVKAIGDEIFRVYGKGLVRGEGIEIISARYSRPFSAPHLRGSLLIRAADLSITDLGQRSREAGAQLERDISAVRRQIGNPRWLPRNAGLRNKAIGELVQTFARRSELICSTMRSVTNDLIWHKTKVEAVERPLPTLGKNATKLVHGARDAGRSKMTGLALAAGLGLMAYEGYRQWNARAVV